MAVTANPITYGVDALNYGADALHYGYEGLEIIGAGWYAVIGSEQTKVLALALESSAQITKQNSAIEINENNSINAANQKTSITAV